MWFEVFVICFTVFLLWIIGKFLVLLDVVHVPKKKCIHLWRSAKNLNQAVYCSICEIMLTSCGFYCESCGVCADSLCIHTAELVLKCKENYTQSSSTEQKVVRDQVHMWVKGNLTQTYECYICQRDIDYHGRPGLYGYRCCWCQRCTHVNCFVKTADDKICDFGRYRNLIIPPNHVYMKRRRLQRITSIVAPDWSEWKPLIVVANLKSGDSTAAGVMAIFRSVLNPIQIFELSASGPGDAIRLISKMRSVQCRILVAGGDGTVGWILNEIVQKNIKPLPEVSILPIGTGNDLSRVLNWGGVPPTDLNPMELCEKVGIENAKVVQLDRWVIDIEGRRSRRLHINWLPHRKLQMYNYFSIGVDAQIALDFHKARASPFYIFSSRVLNKILYLCFGTQQVLDQYCVGLEKKVKVYIDEKSIELPELQSIVCLNIDSWGAGVQLWEMSSEENDLRVHSTSDGLIEVMGIVSSFHMAQLQVGLNKPIRLGQGRKVRIIVRESFPVQADGEPWVQTPCELNISCNGQVKMLKCTT
ncbi:Diacylglycerol kinase epsilon [Pseudolycoriella hygida]|uniref:Diacylglycerol kinase n=1 Tax=Pseudolycoriella hygida TaxID=35572 RepID=A0A9Q0MNT1_9DIPT|nr:Diacylglycerol kinase epsilon [Pseudolycoriella hygida]